MFPLKKEVSERWRDFLCWPLGGSIGPDQLDDSGSRGTCGSCALFTHKLGVYIRTACFLSFPFN